jgi:hypothetical protein
MIQWETARLRLLQPLLQCPCCCEMLRVDLAGVSSLLLATQLLHLLLHAQLPAGNGVNITPGRPHMQVLS